MNNKFLKPPTLSCHDPEFIGDERLDGRWEAHGWPVGWHGNGWFYLSIANPLWFWAVECD